MNERMKSWMLKGAAIALILVLLAGGIALLGSSGLGAMSVNDLLEDAPEVVDGQITIPADEVPKTEAERLGADASALIPSRAGIPEVAPSGEGSEQETAEGVPGAITEQVPPGDRKQLQQAFNRFISRWEHYGGSVLPYTYEHALKRLTTSDGLAAIFARADSVDPHGACVDGCVAESRVLKPYPPITIIDYSPTSAYITAYGMVTFNAGDYQISPLHNRTFGRSYGIMMQKQGGRWLVRRAAAEALGRD